MRRIHLDGEVADTVDSLVGDLDVDSDDDIDAVIYGLSGPLDEALAFDGDFAAAGFVEVRPSG